MNKYLTISILSVLLLSTSCTISKRHYRKGFYVSWSNKKTTVHAKEKQSPVEKKPNSETAILVLTEKIISEAKPVLSASADKTSKPRIRQKQIKTLGDSCGDVMTFRDGSEQIVRIFETTDDYVKYKPCNNLDGPIRTTKSENVFMIRYLDGRKRIFKENPQVTSVRAPARQPVRKRTNGFALASFICAMLSFLFIPAIPALVFGIIGSEQIKKYPEDYKGKWMAITGIIVGGIMTFLLALLIFVNA